MAQITLNPPSNEFMLPNTGEFSIDRGDHFKFFVDSVNSMFNDLYGTIGGSPLHHVTLRGPLFGRYLPSHRDFSIEHGDSFATIIGQINAMFTEVYATGGGTTLAQVTLKSPSDGYHLPDSRNPLGGDSFRTIVTQVNAMMTECYSGPAWWSSFSVNGTLPSVALDFVNGRYYDGTGSTTLAALVSGSPTVSASGMLCNSATIAAAGALLAAMKLSALTIRADTIGGTNFQNAGLVSWGAGAFDAPVFQTASNTVRAFKSTGNVSLDAVNTVDWSKAHTSLVSLNASGRKVTMDGLIVASDATAMAAPTTVALGSYNGGSLFGGNIKMLMVYPRIFTNAEIATGSLPVPFAGAHSIYFGQNVAVNGNLAISTPRITAGSQAVLQWGKAQAWSCVAAINCQSGPVASGAGIIFTTCNANDGVFGGYELWIDNIGVGAGGRLRTRLINHVTTHWIDVQGSSNVCDGVTHKVAMSYDGSGVAAGVKMYVDGVAETLTVTGDTLAGVDINVAPSFLTVGNQFGWPYSMCGMLDEFYLCKGVLSQATIAAFTSAGAQATIDGANAMLAYGFNEGTGTTAADASSNGFTGTLIGNPLPIWD